jgi:hypothetical protein
MAGVSPGQRAPRAEPPPRRIRRGRQRELAARDYPGPGVRSIAAGLVAAGLSAIGEWFGATGREMRREVRRLRGHRVSEVERRRGRKY